MRRSEVVVVVVSSGGMFYSVKEQKRKLAFEPVTGETLLEAASWDFLKTMNG